VERHGLLKRSPPRLSLEDEAKSMAAGSLKSQGAYVEEQHYDA